jgi:energy-coupling factor transporter ATP-binding protein EcfA2
MEKPVPSSPQAAQFLNDVLRQHYAQQIPKAHVPLGVGAFLALSAFSAVPIVPFLGAGLVAYDAVRRLRKNRQIVARSYQDPSVLLKGLKSEQHQTLEAFMAMASAPKALPPLETEGESPAKAKSQPSPPPSPPPASQPATPAATPDPPVVEGWKPVPLDTSLPQYLASQIHILLSATTGSGKTHLLQCLCAILANRGDELVICDPKGSRWGQLSPVVTRMKSGVDYVMVIRDLEAELERRFELNQANRPVGNHIWAVFDEWMLLKGKCSAMEGSVKSAMEQRLLSLIAAGRELNMHLIMVNQSHLLGDLSLSGGRNTFSSGLRDNLCTLGLGCKTTQDNLGKPMEGNSKSIDNMLQDCALIRSPADRQAAQGYHSQIRSQTGVNRTYCIYANSLRIGVVPDLPIPPIQRLTPFYRPKPGQETA